MNSSWIEWNGGKQPVDDGVLVEYELRCGNGETARRNSDSLLWSHNNGEGDIVRYRVEDVSLNEASKAAPSVIEVGDHRIVGTTDDLDITVEPFNKSGSKYLREMNHLFCGRADVYAVLAAFEVTCPARQHAIKKLLCSGIRGKGNVKQDLEEARDALDRSIQMHMDLTDGS